VGVGGGGRSTGGCGVGLPVPHLHVKEAAGDGARAGGMVRESRAWPRGAVCGCACARYVAHARWRTHGPAARAVSLAGARRACQRVGLGMLDPGGWLAAPGPVG
jgi:hypothetical protein